MKYSSATDIKGPPTRWHWAFLSAVSLFLIVVLWISWQQVRTIDKAFRTNLLNKAKGIAHAININHVRDLSFTASDIHRPSFRRLKNQLTQYLPMANCKGIYTIARREARLIFGPESYAENDPVASPPGTVYLEPTIRLLHAFEKPEAFVEGPYTDEYGEFVTAYAPVFDPVTDDLLMMVGMDIEAADWRGMNRKAWLMTLIRAMSVSVIMLGGAWVLWYRRHLSSKWKRIMRFGEVWYTAVVGLLLTAVVVHILYDAESRSRRSAFSDLTWAQISGIMDAVHSLRDHQIYPIARFCEFSVEIEAAEFEGFTAKLLESPGITGIYWVPVEPGNDPDLPPRFPIRFAEPFHHLIAQPEIDLVEDSILKPFFHKAQETGLSIGVSTGKPEKIPLKAGETLVVTPVFYQGSAAGQIRGFVLTVLDIEHYFKSILQADSFLSEENAIGLYLLDYHAPPVLKAESSNGVFSKVLNINEYHEHHLRAGNLIAEYPLFAFGISYVMLVCSGPEFLEDHPLWVNFFATLLGLFATVLGTVFVAFIIRHRTGLETLVNRRTSELLSREELLRATLRSIGDGVISTDRHGIITNINRVSEKLTGWTNAAAIGHPISEVFRIFNSQTLELVENPVTQVLADGDVFELANHTAIKSRTGAISQIADSCAPIRSEDGRIEGAVLVFRDVTSEYARREEIRRINQAIQSSGDAIGICDAEGNHFFQNNTFTRLFEYTAEEIREIHPKTLYADRAIADNVFASITSGGSWSGEVEMVSKSGRRCFMLLRADAVKDDEGKVVALIGIHSDITEKKQFEAELIRSRQQYMLAANGSNDGLWDWDLKTNDLFLSPKWKQMIGYADDELPSAFSTFKDHLHPDDKPRVMEYIDKYLAGEITVYNIEFRFRHKNGLYRWVLARGEALRDERGVPYRMAGSHTDITERKQTEDVMKETNFKLKEAITRAEEMANHAARANAAKSEFLANVSHEIRTPMSGVIGMTGMLLESNLTSDQHHYAEMAHSSGKALLSIIDDILDFSKIEAGKLILENVDFDLMSTVENITEFMAVNAGEKNLEIVSVFDEKVPETLLGDPGRLRQILLNLGGNAIKFTHSGYVIIALTLENESENDVMIRFSVRDTGIGIPEDRQRILFTPFTQVDGSASRSYRGTGLGLAISRQLVEAMSGKIGVHSEEGKGSEFWFTAVFGKLSGRVEELGELPESVDRIKLPVDVKTTVDRVLVVDSNWAIRYQMAHLFRQWRVRASEADCGQVALELIRKAVDEKDPYKIILIGHSLTDMPAAKLVDLVQPLDGAAGIRFVMLSPVNLGVDSEIPIASGFSQVLKKPIRRSGLRQCITRLSRSGTGFVSDDQSEKNQLNSQKDQSILEGIRVLLVEDDPVNRLFIMSRLKKLGCIIQMATNGEEAVEILRKDAFDIVLMDCQMPQMDGFEATGIIRNPDSGVIRPDIPIIALTAHAGPYDRAKCLAAGMTDYLSKPVDKDHLIDVFKRFV